MREVTEREDGTYDLITVGSDRFRLGDVDRSRPYLQARVELLPEPVGAEEPVLLSYLVAAAMIVDLPARQELLAAPDAVSRLTAVRAMLARETALLSSLGSTPATDLRSSPYSPN